MGMGPFIRGGGWLNLSVDFSRDRWPSFMRKKLELNRESYSRGSLRAFAFQRASRKLAPLPAPLEPAASSYAIRQQKKQGIGLR
jgi:hypothetical protein